MNKLKNGIFTVVFATIMTSVMILMTDKSVADGTINTVETSSEDIQQKKQEIISIDFNNADQVELLESASTTINTKTKVESTSVEQKTSEVLTDAQVAPPGLYSKVTSSTPKFINVPFTSEAQAIPKVTSLKNVEMNTQGIQVGKTDEIAKGSSKQAILSANKPIWMQQTLGVFQGTNNANGDAIFNIVPTTADGLQGQDPKSVITTKQHRYISIGANPTYNYQQMSMYNGGYYIAPMPSYLMPSTITMPDKVSDE